LGPQGDIYREVQLPFNSTVMFAQYMLGIAVHGYLYLSDYQTSSSTAAMSSGTTFSWHPYRWLTASENIFAAETHYDGRVWQNDPRDLDLVYDGRGLGRTILISTDSQKESKLAQYIKKWGNNNKVGWEQGSEIGNTGISSANWHVAPQQGAEYYSFLGHNCFWWAQSMLKNSDILDTKDLLNLTNLDIMKYNMGAGTTYIPSENIYFLTKITTISVGAGIASMAGVACVTALLGAFF
jgi:hypothetical protein